MRKVQKKNRTTNKQCTLSFSVLSLIYLSISQTHTETQACRHPYKNTDGQTNIYVHTHTNCTHTLTQTAYLHIYMHTDTHTPSFKFIPSTHTHSHELHTYKHIYIYICIRHTTHTHLGGNTEECIQQILRGKNVHQFMHVVKTQPHIGLS